MLADAVAERDGRIDIRIHPAASLFDPASQYAALRSGALDIAVMPLAYAAGERPAFGLTLLPGLARNHAHAERLAASPFMHEIERLLAEDGIMVLVHGFLAGGLAGRDGCVTAPAHARGLKLRAAAGGAFADTFARAGATIVPLTTGEAYGALQRGEIDAVAASSAGFERDRLFEQVACYTPAGTTAPSLLYQPVLMNRGAFEALDGDARDALLRAARSAGRLYRAEAERQDRLAEEAFRTAGVSIREMLPEEFEAWRALARDAARPLLDRVTDGDRLIGLAFSVE